MLLPHAGSLVEADRRLAERLTESDLWAVLAGIPEDWLPPDEPIGSAERQREAYLTYFRNRLRPPRPFIEEGERARTDADVGAIDPDRATRGRRRE